MMNSGSEIFPIYEWSRNPRTAELNDPRDLLRAIFESRGLFDKKPVYHSPYLMDGIKPAVQRIKTALENNERILVHGDYDVDGIVGAVLLFKFLKLRNDNVQMFLPTRQANGYGFSSEAVDKSAKNGVSLIITVDCGISDNKVIESALAKGIDVIITDHHKVPSKLPDAVAIVHQALPDQNYPYDSLSGAAVAWKLILALAEEIGQHIDKRDYIPYVALSTVADVMPITGENWLIVRDGIAAIRDGYAPHIEILARAAGIELGKVGSRELGFHVASRLNAPGRLKSPVLSAKFLIADKDSNKFKKLASEIEQINHIRRTTQTEVANEAVALALDDDCPVHVLYKPEWHEGVLGTAASSVVEKTGNPAILLTKGDDNTIKGSARSPSGFDLHTLIQKCSDHLKHFGGHEGACGLKIDESRIDDFRESLIKCFAEMNPQGLTKPVIEIMGELSPENVDLKFAGDIDALEPFGKDNERPIFECAPLTIQNANYVGGASHLKLDFDIGKNKTTKGIFFKINNVSLGSIIGRRVSIAGSPMVNEFNGRKNVEFQISDLKILD